MNLKSKACSIVAVLLALITVFTGAPPAVVSQAQGSTSTGNTGYEDYYYYIGNVVNAANGNLFFRAKDTFVNTGAGEFASSGLRVRSNTPGQVSSNITSYTITSYNSLNSDIDSPLGFGWTSGYNVRLSGTGNMTYYDADGSKHTFTDTGNGTYSSPPGIRSKLVKNPDTSFTLWHKDGSKYNFSSGGQLQSIVDKNGNSLLLTYTGGNLTRVEDNTGLALTFAYSSGKISSVTDPLGREIHYYYDGGNLSRVTDALGQSTIYYYSANHVLRSAINRYGGMLNFRYSANQVVEVSSSLYNRTTGLPSNRTTLYSISYGNGVTVATDSRGFRTTVQTNNNGNPVSILDPDGGITTMTWDASLNSTSYTDANGKTSTYTYDSRGNMVSETDPLGRTTNKTWNNVDNGTSFISLLTSATDARGNVTAFTYDSKGNLTQMTDALNGSLSLTYDAYGNRTSYIDFRGKTTAYTYDTHGNRLTETDPLNNTTTYAYDTIGRLVSETDAAGRVTSYEYDANNRLIKKTNPLSGETRLFYNEEGSLTKTIDPAGQVTEYSHNLGGSVNKITDAAGQVISRVYDTKGNLVSSTDARGGITRMTYDGLGRITSVIDAAGKTESYTYDRAGNRLGVTDKRGNTTTYEYNGTNLLTKGTDALGNQTTYQYDAADNRTNVTDASGNLTTYEYDALNRVTRATQAGVILLDVTYDANSNIASIKDARNNTTTYQYDALNRRTHVNDPLGNQTVTAYDAVGRRTSVTDRRGNATSYQYDALGRVTTVTAPLGNTTTVTYEPGGKPLTRTDALGNMDIFEYDSLGRKTKHIEATKDAQGNPVPKATTLYSYDALGNLISQTDANGNTATNQYDAVNRLIRETDALGRFTSYEYDAIGNRTKTTDPNGSVTTYQYDTLGRMVKQIDALGNQTTFTYDARGNVTGFTDARGNTTGYTYDAFNRLTKITSPLGNETSYTYNATGNALTRTDASGNVTSYQYDALNRRTGITYPDASTVNYTYDTEGNITRIASSGGAGETTDNTYDALNRILSTSVNYGTFTKTISYTYNAAGKRTTMTDPMGGATSYTYDFAGRELTLNDPAGSVTTSEWDASGRRTKITYPNGAVTTYAYDTADRLLTLATKKSGGETISSFTYAYDNAGNRTSVTESNGDATAYVYDALSRLIRVTDPAGAITNYTYDTAGNRLTESKGANTTAYTYDAENRMLTAGAVTYTYNANGNTVSKTEGASTTAYQYDYENRLTRVTLPDASQINYKYAPYGDRLSRTDSTGTAFYFYDIRDMLAEMDGTGATVARYTHGPGIDEPVKLSRDGVSSYYHFDGLGSVTTLTDATQNTAATYKYDAFGVITQQTGSVVNPYRFTSREYDPATGLYYLRARYYDPLGGRFISKDPWGSTFDELNQYLYALNNPVNRVDLFGGKSGAIKFDGKRYSLDDYDEDCLMRAYAEYQKAWEKMNAEAQRMAKELNNMLNKLRNDAKERRDTAAMHAVIGTYLGTAVGALVGALTANPLLGAAAGAAAGAAYNAATSGSVSGTDAAQGALGVAGDLAGTFAGAVASTVNLYWSTSNLQESYEQTLEKINEMAEQLQKDLDKFVADLSKAAKDTYHTYAETNCKKRKEPPVVQTPPTISTGGGRTPTDIPTGERSSGGATTEGTGNNDLEIETEDYIDPDITEVPIVVTIANRGLQTVTGRTLDTKVYSHPLNRKVLLVADEPHGKYWYYQEALDSLDVTYDTVFIDTQYTPKYEDSDPNTKDLKDYDVVLWESSYDTSGTLEGIAQPELETYLDNGGCLGVFGSGIMFQWQATTGTLMSDYMFADGYGKKFTGAIVDGVPETIGEGFHFEELASRENYSIKGVKPGGQEFFLYRGSIAGIQADSGQYKTVLSTVTVDNHNMPLAADRKAFMGRTLEFLDCRYRHPNGGGPPSEPPTVPPLEPGQITTVTVPVTVPTGGHTVVITLSGSDDNPGNNSSTTKVYTKPSPENQTPIVWPFEVTFLGGQTQPQPMGWQPFDGSVKTLAKIQCPIPYNAYVATRTPAGGTGGSQPQQVVDMSWWFGVPGTDPQTGVQYPGGYGYGNNWDEFLKLPDIVIPAGADPWLSFVARYDTEPNDIAYVEVYNPSTFQWQPLVQYSGNSQGWVEGLTYEIPDGLFSPLKLRFHFVSDAQNSDEDGLFDSEGAFWVDNIKVYDNVTSQVFYYNTGSDGSGQEVGAPPWGESATGVGSSWHLHERNGSWQWAAFDMQTGVWKQNLLDQLIMPVIDTTWINRPGLFYDLEMNLPSTSADSLKIAVSTDGGQSWTYVEELGGTFGEQSPSPIDLAAYKSQNFRVMFEANGSGNTHTWGVYLDNITLKEFVPPQPPVASFTFSPANPAINQTVTFDASSSSDADDNIVAYDWDFGDGTTATAVNPNWSSSSPFIFKVRLKVTDTKGLTDTMTVEVPVALPQQAQLPSVTSLNPNQGNKGQALAVTITGSNFTGATAVSFGSSISVSSFTVNSSTQITANVSIGAGAALGARDVSVTTPEGTGTLTGGFNVTAAVVPGDANGDGLVNALDITRVERAIAGLDASTPGADANNDGQVNALDITKVERLIAGLD